MHTTMYRHDYDYRGAGATARQKEKERERERGGAKEYGGREGDARVISVNEPVKGNF